MKLKEAADLCEVMANRLRNLEERTKHKETITYFERTELSEILLDSQDLYAGLLETWRFIKVKN